MGSPGFPSLVSDQSDDSAPLGGLGQDRILDVNLNLDLPPVDLDLPPVDLGLGAVQCMDLELGNSLARHQESRWQSVFRHLLSMMQQAVSQVLGDTQQILY